MSRFDQKESTTSLAVEDSEILDWGYYPIEYPLTNRSFAVVVIGCNNGAFVQRTLGSVFDQNYENFRIIYIDDASDDGSFELARDMIYDSGHLMRLTLVHNEKRLGFLANLMRAVEACPDHEIVVVLKGEDWLAHEWVLERLNKYYADPDLWLTYGGAKLYPRFMPGISRPYTLDEWTEKGPRGLPYISSHLQSFYAALFRHIDEKDFVYQGAVFQKAGNLAYMLPMLEMAADHFQCVSETLYIRSRLPEEEELTPAERFIRSRNPYKPLSRLFAQIPLESL